jgi:hypothetical protein
MVSPGREEPQDDLVVQIPGDLRARLFSRASRCWISARGAASPGQWAAWTGETAAR